MRRITLAVVSTVAILVLLFSYRTSTNQSPPAASAVSTAHIVGGGSATSTSTSGPPTPGATSTPAPGAAPTKPPAAGAATSSTPSAPATTASAPLVVDGTSARTRYGPVQVEVTIVGNKITDVKAIQYPTQDSRDRQINSAAIPLLRTQVISTQSANIDGVSGATYTTEGYVASLQSALDAANFK